MEQIEEAAGLTRKDTLPTHSTMDLDLDLSENQREEEEDEPEAHSVLPKQLGTRIHKAQIEIKKSNRQSIVKSPINLNDEL